MRKGFRKINKWWLALLAVLVAAAISAGSFAYVSQGGSAANDVVPGTSVSLGHPGPAGP